MDGKPLSKAKKSSKPSEPSPSSSSNSNEDGNKSPPPKIKKKKAPEVKRFENSKIQRYVKLDMLGRGTYGKVFKALDEVDNCYVAVKQLKIGKEKEGFPITAIREVKILKSLKHVNVVQLINIIASLRKPKFWMIFEYVEHDLMGLLSAKIKFDESSIKSLMQQLLSGMHFLHSNNVIHRDLKTSNLLITKNGHLKIADFGLARYLKDNKHKKKSYTNRVVTRWYRAPELLLGERQYTQSIDMWSIGCIFAELLNSGRPLFPGKDSLDQLRLIYKTCGSATAENWPSCVRLPLWKEMSFKKKYHNILEKKFFKKCSKNALNLLTNLLRLDPAKRLSAKECLSHAWFLEEKNPPKAPYNLPKESNFNELNAQINGRKKRRHVDEIHEGGPPRKKSKYYDDGFKANRNTGGVIQLRDRDKNRDRRGQYDDRSRRNYVYVEDNRYRRGGGRPRGGGGRPRDDGRSRGGGGRSRRGSSYMHERGRRGRNYGERGRRSRGRRNYIRERGRRVKNNFKIRGRRPYRDRDS